MKKISLILLAILLLLPAFTRSEENKIIFSDFFKDKTMRLDFFHTGNFQREIFSIDRIISDGIWSGSKVILADNLNLGLYQFQVIDPCTKNLLYSRGFCSIFGEWQTIPQAKKIFKTFHESLRFPWPKKAVEIVLKKRDKKNKFRKIWSTLVDPESRQVNPADRINTNKIYTILENGPADQKVDLVVLGDGYLPGEMKKFRSDAKRLTGILMNAEPYKSRKTDFNIRAIETPSQTSGITKPHPGIFKRTPLSIHYSSFDSERYVLGYNNRTIRDIASAVPYDFMIILVNEKTYGGGGIYGLYGTLSVDNKFSNYIIIHELGHHIAGLADEYYSASVSYDLDQNIKIEPWELNVTAQIDREHLKWSKLVKQDTPLPTPWMKKEFDKFNRKIQKERTRLRSAKAEEKVLEALFIRQKKIEQQMFSKMKYHKTIGAFEGAAYQSRGLYRSSTDCIMFTRSLKFCPVCLQALNSVFDQYTK
jgi:hypothetical protein